MSPHRLGKAREMFNIFNVFNAVSWNLLVGSIITLYVIRLGASSTYIGTLAAMFYVSLFFLPLGRLLTRKISVITIFSMAWTLRSFAMIPVVLAPLAVRSGNADLALGMTMIGVAIFHVTRGIGMVGNTPVISSLAAGPDRGSYITQVQIINSATNMVSGFAIAIILGREPPLFLYSVIMAIGIVCGIASGLMLRKVPEPPRTKAAGIPLAAIFREAFSQNTIRLFLFIFMIVALVSGVSRTFLVVYAREVFSQDDGMVLLYSVFGGLGQLLIGLLVKFFIDRIGAKPLFIICMLIGLMTMIPIVFFPRSGIENLTMGILFLALMFFMLNFGFLGSEGIAQTYFLGLVPADRMLDMGILYFFVFGAAGAGGSLLAGLLLDFLALVGLSPFVSFKILFAAIIVLTGVAVFFQHMLTPLGALPLSGAVKVMFSYRDLQAISLLDRLDRSQDFQEQERLLDELNRNPSQLSMKGLLERTKSPRLATRLESIRALGRLESLDEAAERALINDIVDNHFTTAYISARALGKHGYAPAIPVLRELIHSEDYMLAGEAMIALARLKDSAFRPQLEELVVETGNPRLKIMGAQALGIYRQPASLAALMDMLKDPDPPPYMKEELALAMAEILGMQNRFNRSLSRFLVEPALAANLCLDTVETATEFYRANSGGSKSGRKKSRPSAEAMQAESLHAAVSALVNESNAVPLATWIRELPETASQDKSSLKHVKDLFCRSLEDPELVRSRHLHLLASHWAAGRVRGWAKKG
ncbi:MAG: HEAT repeat domain-containing protein [Treponema sp.]|nr:HEAT repeat domain-containing protein [Treponema sp.]